MIIDSFTVAAFVAVAGITIFLLVSTGRRNIRKK
jgi:hypothetical protein